MYTKLFLDMVALTPTPGFFISHKCRPCKLKITITIIIAETKQKPNSTRIETLTTEEVLRDTVAFCRAFLYQGITVTLFIPDTLIRLVSVRRNHETNTHRHAVISLAKVAKTQDMQKKKHCQSNTETRNFNY